MNPEVVRLVRRLRATADILKDAHPLDVNADGAAIDLRQGANTIEDLAREAEAAFHTRLHRALDEAMRSFVRRESGYEAFSEWSTEPEDDGSWTCLVSESPMLIALNVSVKLG